MRLITEAEFKDTVKVEKDEKCVQITLSPSVNMVLFFEMINELIMFPHFWVLVCKISIEQGCSI